jgi:transposase
MFYAFSIFLISAVCQVTLLVILALLWGKSIFEFSVRVAPRTDTVYWIIKQFEETGSLCDKHGKGRKQFYSSFARSS